MKFDGSEQQLEMLREIADNILDPVFLVDRGFNVWYFNRAFETTVGVRMNSRRYKDRPCYELLGLGVCKDNCVMKQAVATKQNVRLAEIPGKPAGGEEKNFHINAIPVSNEQGTPFGALIFLRDITAETQIHEKYKQLVARNGAISLSGQIEAGNLVDIIQLFIFLQKSGQLDLKSDDATGTIVFERGQLVGIILGEAAGEKALDRMLGWLRGTFSFSPKVTVSVEQRLEGSADFLLMNALRERDELAARQNEAPPSEARPSVLRIATSGDEADEGEGLEGLLWQVYELAVEGRTVGQIQAGLPHSDSRVLVALLELRDQGIVSW